MGKFTGERAAAAFPPGQEQRKTMCLRQLLTFLRLGWSIGVNRFLTPESEHEC